MGPRPVPVLLLLLLLLASLVAVSAAGARPTEVKPAAAAEPERLVPDEEGTVLKGVKPAATSVSISSFGTGNTSPRERPARKQTPAARAKLNSGSGSKCPAACPSALEAAKALLGNTSLSVSNARMTGCTLRAAHVPNAVLLQELDGPWVKHFDTAGALVLSSGNANAMCPDEDQAAAGFDVTLGTSDDADWGEVVGAHTDTTALEFDVTSRLPGDLSISYAFASSEVVNEARPANDGVGVFVGGRDVATLPGRAAAAGSDPLLLTAATLRNFLVAPSELQVQQQAPAQQRLWRGDHSVLLTTQQVPVKAGQPTRVKLVVADTGDSHGDSWALFKLGSLQLHSTANCSPLDGPCCSSQGQLRPAGALCGEAGHCQQETFCDGATAACAAPSDHPIPEGGFCAWPKDASRVVLPTSTSIYRAASASALELLLLDSMSDAQAGALTRAIPAQHAHHTSKFWWPACTGKCLAGHCFVKQDEQGCKAVLA